jgi:hypothetical protein
VTEFDVQRQEWEVEDLEGQLHRTPATIDQPYTATWPHTVKTVEKRAGLAAEVRTAAGGVRFGTPTRTGWEATAVDSTIEDPNPDIGLNHDPLTLPADWDLFRKLLEQAGPELAGTVIGAAVAARADEARARAETLEREGKEAEATEAWTECLLLLAPVHPDEASRLMDRLRP